MYIEEDGIGKLIRFIIDFYRNGIDDHPMVFALFIILMLDILLGYLRAWAGKGFSSSVSRAGLANHFFVFVTGFIAYPLAVLGNVTTEADMFLYYLFFSYAASIIKNADTIGLRVPYISNYISQHVDHHKENEEVNNETNKSN